MTDKPNHPLNFWQELKRRKVVRVIIVYAAAAYAILELTDIVAPSLGLPDWTLNLIIILLCIGFIITVIVSWIYDITPEGIEKTKPVHEVSKEDKPVTSKSWKIASYISFVVILGLVILNVLPRGTGAEKDVILEKSIAVIPFIDDSPNKDNEHIINGIMEDLLINLQSIKDLRVPGRTSIEQYRNNPKPIPDIATELGVNYIVEGSGQKYGNHYTLRVQLLEGATGMHIWGHKFEQEIESVEDIVNFISAISSSIAEELEAIISPDEKLLIEKVPTTSLTAYDFFQRGRDEHYKYWLDYDNREALERAEDLYYEALKYDSTFAQAYTGLALIYYNKRFWESLLSDNFMDSLLILTDIALSFDNQLAEAYVLKGYYYEQHDNKEQALIEYDKAIKYNPNNWMAYFRKASLFSWGDVLRTLDNSHKAASLHRGALLPGIYRSISHDYTSAGFDEIAKYYLNEAFKLDNDSVKHYIGLVHIEDCLGNFEKVIVLCDKILKIDSSYPGAFSYSANSHRALGQHVESLENIKEVMKIGWAGDTLSNDSYGVAIGYAYLMNGYPDEAQYHLQKGLEYQNKFIELGRQWGQNVNAFYGLAAGYAVLGDTERALYNLNALVRIEGIPLWVITKTEVDPLFKNIWDEPEFKRIMKILEDNYQAEHERVRNWLEENDML